jgi:hypothetical protein
MLPDSVSSGYMLTIDYGMSSRRDADPIGGGGGSKDGPEGGRPEREGQRVLEEESVRPYSQS